MIMLSLYVFDWIIDFLDFVVMYTYSATFSYIFIWGSIRIYQNWKDCTTRTILETQLYIMKLISPGMLCGLFRWVFASLMMVTCMLVGVLCQHWSYKCISKFKYDLINKPVFSLCCSKVSYKVTFVIFPKLSECDYCS